MKIFNNIFIFIMVFFIFACSNTRVVMEGVKKVINNQEEEKQRKIRVIFTQKVITKLENLIL